MAESGPNAAIVKDPREYALRLLMEIADHQLLVPQASLRIPSDLTPANRQLSYEMVYGTLRFLPGLEGVLHQFCPKPRFPHEIRWLLLMSLYQMGFMRIPDYASVNEALRLVKRMKMPGLRGLVNAVLRNAGRKGRALWPEAPDGRWLLPPWLLARFRSQYGEAIVNGWLEQWQERPQTSYWSSDDNGLENDQRVPGLPHTFRHEGPFQAEALASERCYVQNESSQAIAEIACRLKPESVLDLCAAPGGKSCYVAAFGEVQRLLACDISSERLANIAANKTRLGLDFEMIQADGRQWQTEERFDLVMVDAPCSGLGIIGRHPEIKLHKTEPAPTSLLALQADLMVAGYRLLKPGGHLLFTVCTLDKSEVPAPPEEAEVDLAWLATNMPNGIAQIEEDRFTISPTTARDGFQGVLLKKPLG